MRTEKARRWDGCLDLDTVVRRGNQHKRGEQRYHGRLATDPNLEQIGPRGYGDGPSSPGWFVRQIKSMQGISSWQELASRLNSLIDGSVQRQHTSPVRKR